MARKICIAAGHGGFDPGCVGNGLQEKDINLAIALDLEAILTKAGVPVVMTRTTDVAAGGSTTVMGDLTSECRIANDSGADLFFCIHTNSGGGNGAEAYVYPGSSVATLARQQVEALAGLVGTHGEPVKYDSQLYVLRNTSMQAILIEVGFIDSSDSVKLRDHLHDFGHMLAPGLIAWAGGNMSALNEPHAVAQPAAAQPDRSALFSKADSLVNELQDVLKQLRG